MNKDALLAKLEVLSNSLIDKINTECTSPDISISAYTSKINEVKDVVEEYFSPIHKQNRETLLNETITTLYNVNIFNILAINAVDTGETITTGIPTDALTDISDFFRMKEFESVLNTITVNDLWQGCVSSENGLGDNSFIDVKLKQVAMRQYSKDVADLKNALTAITVRLINITLFIYFNDISLSKTQHDKQDIANVIYVDKHILPIIDYFELSIYVPKYLRG